MQSVKDVLDTFSSILDELKRVKLLIVGSEKREIDEYVFVPLVNGVKYEYDGVNLILKNSNNVVVKIRMIDNNKHITKIRKNDNDDNDGTIDVNNILVLRGYAVNEHNIGLVHTLDNGDYVYGMLLNGRIETKPADLSEYTIIYSKTEVLNKLYFYNESEIDLQNDIKITLLVDLKTIVGKTDHNFFNQEDAIEGIAVIYGVYGDKKLLAKKLGKVINYYSLSERSSSLT